MNIFYSIIALITLALAVYSFLLSRWLHFLKKRFRTLQNKLQKASDLNLQLEKSNNLHHLYSVIGGGHWELRRFADGVLVCKCNCKGNIQVAARWYPFNVPITRDEEQYKVNCASELLEKLTETV